MTYSDIEKSGWIQPYKPVYTMRDFHRLHKKYPAVIARFILMCSAAHYDIDKGKECRVTRSLEKVDKFITMDSTERDIKDE